MPRSARAAGPYPLNFVSDTISDSRNSLPANHTIEFQVPDGVPAGGTIVIAFEHDAFSVDPSFSYADVDLAVSTSSPYSGFAERTIAATPGATDDGVAVTPLTGPFTTTLSPTDAIPAGAYVRFMFGTNAPGGTYQISNPPSTASYRILIDTFDAAHVPVDYGAAMVAILPGVSVTPNTDKMYPATLSNGLPSGTIPSNIVGVLVSFNTDTYAACRYATSSGVLYDDMTNAFAANAAGMFHTTTVTGIVQGTTYALYARCMDWAGNRNLDDYVISFTAGLPTGTNGGGGGGSPYPPGPAAPSLVIRGIAMPNATIGVLQDGARISVAATADSFGSFAVTVPSLPQGTYSFTVQALNANSTPISSYTSAITLIAGTTNSITDIVLPPAIAFATSTVALGKSIAITGLSEPSAVVDLVTTSQAGLRASFEATTTAGPNGAWTYALSTVGFPADTYQLKARALPPGFAASAFSPVSFLGVGQAPVPKLKVGDLNGDGKVNLADFSIMLFYWGKNYAPAEFDGKSSVDLQDLSIMLYNWTG